jgi:site-specific DNA-methyltransferase (adenine-specific)/modification methylase
VSKLEINQVYQGDCLELLGSAPIANAIIADPPYVMSLRSDGAGRLNWADYVNYAYWFAGWISIARTRLEPDGCLWVFLNWRSVAIFQKVSFDINWSIESMLVWNKCRIGPSTAKGLRPAYELIALFAMPEFAISNRGIPDVQAFPLKRVTEHPAEKPQQLIRFLIEHSTKEGDIVIDPFVGSGTTCVVAVQLDRNYIGIEQDLGWYEKARKRIDEAKIQHNKIKQAIKKYETI